MAHENVWVADTYNARMQELNEQREFLRAFGTGQGQIIESAGVAIGPVRNVWVADCGTQRVEEFSKPGRSFASSAPKGPAAASSNGQT